MFAMVIFICYLGEGCENLMVDAYTNKAQCIRAVEEQRLRRANCFPIEDYVDGYWIPAQEYVEF